MREEYLDDCEDRYAKLKESSHAYIINQFGLSCFRPVTAGESKKKQPAGRALLPTMPEGWEASTFNFYIFPEPLKDSNQVSRVADCFGFI